MAQPVFIPYLTILMESRCYNGRIKLISFRAGKITFQDNNQVMKDKLIYSVFRLASFRPEIMMGQLLTITKVCLLKYNLMPKYLSSSHKFRMNRMNIKSPHADWLVINLNSCF